MNKTHVVIASVLKPVDDTRMYEKFALTLLEEQKYHIHIIGFYSPQKKFPEFITAYPIFNFSRLSIKRLFASWKYYKILIKVKPSIIVVTTPELQIVTILYKIIFGAKILYDVQENYLYNSLYSKKFRRPLNFLIGYLMRIVEYISSPFISFFILAEHTYKYELPFLKNKYVVIDNKYKPIQTVTSSKKERDNYHLLYSGTISESYGIYRAIDLAVRLHKVEPKFHLTIMGFCPDTKVLINVKETLKPFEFIRLIGGDMLVPHEAIVSEIQSAGIGLVAYEYNKSTFKRVPTKLYEYIYHKLPIILTENPLWEMLCSEYKAAIVVNYLNYDSVAILNSINNFPFYYGVVDFSPILWDYNKENLKKVFIGFK